MGFLASKEQRLSNATTKTRKTKALQRALETAVWRRTPPRLAPVIDSVLSFGRTDPTKLRRGDRGELLQYSLRTGRPVNSKCREAFCSDPELVESGGPGASGRVGVQGGCIGEVLRASAGVEKSLLAK